MKYFLLKPDKSFKDGPVIKTIPFEQKLVCKELFHKISKRQVVSMTTTENTLFPDLFAVPALIISEMILSVAEMYGDPVLKRDLVFIDSDAEIIQRYFVVLFESVSCDCIEDKGEGVRTVYIKREGRPLKERNVFEIKENGKREIIINLDFAESILRRRAFAIHLEEIEVYETDKTEV